MKNFGLFLVFSACVSMGVFYCRARKRRLIALQQLLTALERMAAEIGSRGLPMPELCKQLSEREGELVRPFFTQLLEGLDTLGERPFAQLWVQALEDKLDFLGQQSLEELYPLGASLGRYELPYQLAALGGAVGAIRTSLEAARLAYPGERKLGMGLSLAAGLLVLIMGV